MRFYYSFQKLGTILMTFLIYLLIFFGEALFWPDGAPCKYSTMKSMNPLEAVEHEGGLQVILFTISRICDHLRKLRNLQLCV